MKNKISSLSVFVVVLLIMTCFLAGCGKTKAVTETKKSNEMVTEAEKSTEAETTSLFELSTEDSIKEDISKDVTGNKENESITVAETTKAEPETNAEETVAIETELETTAASQLQTTAATVTDNNENQIEDIPNLDGCVGDGLTY